MKLTVERLLQLVRDAIAAEPDSFGRKAALRRLAQLDVSSMNHVSVDIPKPEMSEEAEELLKNSPKAKPVPPKPEGTAVATKKRKPRRKKREPVEVPEVQWIGKRKSSAQNKQEV